MATMTSVSPFGARQVNHNLYVGQSDLNTIQKAVTFAYVQGGTWAVIIPAGYTGSDTIAAVVGGSTDIYITDERVTQPAWYGWDGTAYIVEKVAFAELEVDDLQAASASFDECLVEGSPVRTFANTGDGGGTGMEFPPIGVGVSTGTAWGASIPKAGVARLDLINPTQPTYAQVPSFTGVDLNTVMIGGVTIQINPTNYPSAIFFDLNKPYPYTTLQLETLPGAGTFVLQRAMWVTDPLSRVFTRFYNGTSWGAWESDQLTAQQHVWLGDVGTRPLSYKIATLPPSTPVSGDQFSLTLCSGDITQLPSRKTFIFHNRNGFAYSWYAFGQTLQPASALPLGVRCYSQADGTVDIYIWATGNGTAFQGGSYSIDFSTIDVTIYAPKVASVTPTGTLVFDSYLNTQAAGQYPPNAPLTAGVIRAGGLFFGPSGGALTQPGVRCAVTSPTDMIVSPSGAGSLYLNWDGGTGGVLFGNGAGNKVAAIDSAGNATFGSLSLQPVLALTGSDLNTLTTTTTVAVNAPSANYPPTGPGAWIVQVIVASAWSNHIQQIAYSITAAQAIWTRNRYFGAWGAWMKFTLTSSTSLEEDGHTDGDTWVEDGRIYAMVDGKKMRTKARLEDVE